MANVKAGQAIQKMLTKFGVPSEIVTKISDLVKDVEDELDEDLVSALMTESEAERTLTTKLKPKFESAGKAVVRDFFDKSHAKYEALLPEDKKTEYDALKSTEQKNEFLLEYFQGRNVGNQDAAAFKKALSDYQKKVQDEYIEKSKYSELEQKISPAYKKATEASIIKEAYKNGNISATAKNDRRFESNFLNDFNEVLEKNKWRINHETGEVVNSEGEPIVEGSDILTSSAVINKVVDTYDDWKKKSEGSGTSAEVIVTGGKDTSGLTAAQIRNLDRLNG